jgi:hypothetical protein
MLRTHHNIRAHPIARRPLRAGQRQINVLLHLIRPLVIKLSPKDPPQVHPLELDRFSLLHLVPRHGDRVRPLLPRGHERPIPDLPARIRKRPSNNIVHPIRIREHSGKNDRLPRRYLRYVRLQAKKHRRPFHRRRGRISARRCAVGSPRSSTRVHARGHGPGHRAHGRRRGFIIPTTSRNDPQNHQKLPSCSHPSSVPGDADAHNPGSQHEATKTSAHPRHDRPPRRHRRLFPPLRRTHHALGPCSATPTISTHSSVPLAPERTRGEQRRSPCLGSSTRDRPLAVRLLALALLAVGPTHSEARTLQRACSGTTALSTPGAVGRQCGGRRGSRSICGDFVNPRSCNAAYVDYTNSPSGCDGRGQ